MENKINDLEIKFEEKINNIRSNINETNKAVNEIQTSPERVITKKKAMIVQEEIVSGDKAPQTTQ